MRRVSRWGTAWLVFAVTGVFALVVVAGPVDAAINRPFGIRYQSTDNGDILLRGNSLLTCPTSAATCAAARLSNTAATPNNNSYAMEFVDVDSDGSTQSSSSARVTIPPGASVKFAGLYWSAYTGGTGRNAPPAGTSREVLRFKAPGATQYSDVTAAPSSPQNPVNGTSEGIPYVSFANVTNIVRNAGSGDYTAADIHAATGSDAYAAWSLVLVLRDPSQPKRNLIVFDGFGTIQTAPAADNTLEIPLTGLSTPSSGQVDVRLGTVVFEGDPGLTGDQYQLVPPTGPAVTLSDALNPANNPFNSTNSDNGSAVPGRNPDGNLFGFDADVFQSTALLGPSASTATLRMSTTGERFFPAVATFVSNTYAPQLDLVRSANVLQTVPVDTLTRTGDRIEYTVTVTNSGDNSATDARISELIPAGTTYVPGSLKVGGTPRTDASGDDQGEFTGTALNVRLGSGATDTAGGTLAPGASVIVTYEVRITDAFTKGGTVSGSTDATYSDPANRTYSTESNVISTQVDPARADLVVTQVPTPGVIQTAGPRDISWAVKVTNNGPDAETAPVLVETLPANATAVTVTGATCSNVGLRYTCQLPTLASGASDTVTFKATLGSGPTAATAVVSGDAIDPASANNSDSTGVSINGAPVAQDDFGQLNDPAVTTLIDVLDNDSDPDSGDVLSVDSVLTQPAHGTAAVDGDQIRYTLTDPTFVGTDTFTYRTCDNRGGCSSATVQVAVNDHRRADLKVALSASPETVQRAGNREVTWTAVVTNVGPQDQDGPKLVQQLPPDVTGLTITGCSALTCTLPDLASGATTTVRFTATLPNTAADPSIATATVSGTIPDPDPTNNDATVSVGVNRPPVTTSDTRALPADLVSVDVDVTANDQDPDSDPLTITAVENPAHGTATIVGGKIRYTLVDHTFVGNDTFGYTVCDGRGGCTDSTVTIDVADHDVADLVVTQSATPKLLQRNGPRVASWTVTVKNAGPERAVSPVLTQTLPAGASAIEFSSTGCTVSGVVVTCPLDTLANGASTEVTFTATLPADAPDPVVAKAAVTTGSVDPDKANNSASASVALNTRPVSKADSVDLASSATRMTIDVLANDQDADKDPLKLSKVGKAKHGTTEIVKGKIVYKLTDLAFAGDDTFTYQVCDDRSGCDSTEVTVRVADHQHPPVARTDRATVVSGDTVRIDVAENDTDEDGGRLKVTRITRPARDGTAKLVGGKLVYTPDPGFEGTDTVRYEICDPTDLCDQAAVVVKVTAAPPVLKLDTGSVRPGGTVVIDVLGNDVDPSGYPIGSVTIVGQPSTGTATVKDNKIHYQAPSSAPAGTVVAIRYRACNDSGVCSTGTVRLKIAGDPVEGGGLAYTGTRIIAPLTLAAVALLLAGAMVRGLSLRPQTARRRIPRGRHKL